MKKEVQMRASFIVRFKEPTNTENADFSIGGFAIENEKGIIPFDFDASMSQSATLSARECHVDYISELDPVFNDFDVSNGFDEEYGKLALSHQDITAQFLSSATKLIEFYFLCINEDKKPIPCEILVEKIDFRNENDEHFQIHSDVIKNFNEVNKNNLNNNSEGLLLCGD